MFAAHNYASLRVEENIRNTKDEPDFPTTSD